MKNKQQLKKEIESCEKVIRKADEMHKHLRPATTKFKVTMEIEVVDVGNIPASSVALLNSITTKIESISSGDVVKVSNIAVSQKTFPNGLRGRGQLIRKLKTEKQLQKERDDFFSIENL